MRKSFVRLLLALAAATAFGGGGLLALRTFEAAPVAPNVLPEVPATPMDRSAGRAHNSPKLAASPIDPSIVAMAHRLDAPEFGCGLQVSKNGGTSWSPARPIAALPEGADRCYNPEVGFDSDGRVYYLFVGLAGEGNVPMGVFLTRSTDGARTFDTPSKILGPQNFSVRLAIDVNADGPDRLHLVWISARSDVVLGGFGAPPNPIVAAYSDDGGRTFSDVVEIAGASGELVAAPALAIGAGNQVYVAFYDLGQDMVDYRGLEGAVFDGTWSVLVAASSDGGANFERTTVVDASVIPTERIMLILTMPPPGLTANDQLVCVAWTDGETGDPDALANCSRDRGRRWGQPIRLNDDSPGNGRSQYQPQLDLSTSGILSAVFYDRRRSLQNLHNEISFTYSTDAGRSFAPNRTLSKGGSSSIGVGPEYAIPSAKGQVEFGSRMGLLHSDGVLLAAWTDTRNSLSLSTDQDIFTVRVQLGVAERGRRIWTMMALLTAIGVVAIVFPMARRHMRARAQMPDGADAAAAET